MPYTEVKYVLNNGKEFTKQDEQTYKTHEHLFGWVDAEEINKRTRRMTGNTHFGNKSVITIKENGQIEYNANLPLN